MRTDSGIEGIVEDLLTPLLLGEDPHAIAVLWDRMFSAMRLRSHM